MAWNFHKSMGKFSIEVADMLDNPEVIQAIMATCIVIRAEHIFEEGAVSYTASSPHFREVVTGETVPSYDMVYDPDTGVVGWEETESGN